MKRILTREPEYTFIGWMVFLPSFLFQTSLAVRVFQILCIVFVYSAEGKKFKLVPNVLLFTGVTVAHLLRPAGEVLFSWKGIVITEEALVSGISRSLLLIGLVYISRISVTSHLHFPGRAGRLLSSVFFYFEEITRFNRRPEKGKIKMKSFFTTFTEFMDGILFLSDSFDAERNTERNVEEIRGKSISLYFMIPFLIASYTLLILNFLKYI